MKTALFVLLDQYADWEGAYLMSLLNQRDNWQVKTASNLPQVESIGGIQTTVDLNLSKIDQMYHLLVLIGGNSWNIHSKELYAIIEQQLSHDLPVAAICGAVDYLALHGFLEGYRHTGNARFLWKDFPNYQTPGNFIERQAVSDRNLVTANGTAALDFTEFALQLIGDSLIEAKREVDLYRLGFYGYREKYGNPFV
ncbi:DJ-1/PfpI family protein [Enterococcus sp.]|uniref:DJ-1/PfpI family protein n=1 Tax=Enterococcus sp. TaxID=35783 RepID=UPI00290A7255|nr:DJ-1/PfpI family protein [Enterococcus sp.]MDU5335937.1 DJ-1/PfpI family protein [Enterococcus sp.]